MEYLISSKKKYVNVKPVLHLEYDADNLHDSHADSKCLFRGVDFASFHSRCFLSLRKRNSRNFFALTLFTVCTTFARGIRVSIFFIFLRKIPRELKRSFDYAILRVSYNALMFVSKYLVGLFSRKYLLPAIPRNWRHINFILSIKNVFLCFSQHSSSLYILFFSLLTLTFNVILTSSSLKYQLFRKRSEIETKRRLISRSLIRWSLRLKKFEGCVWRNGHYVKCQEELLSFAVLSFLFMAFNFLPQIVLLYPFCVCRFSSFTADSYHFIAPFLLRKEHIAF